MDDLIPRAAAMDVFMGKPPDFYHTSYIVGELNCVPAVDAVPVVRCRDCKYFVEHNDGQGGNCNHLDYDGEYEFSVAGDWFCADGERRDGA